MFSFKSLALTAAIAFGAFTTAFAAPTIGADIASIAERDVSVRSVAVILADVTVKVTPIVAELGFLTKANATVDVITPLCDDIRGVFAEAIVEVNALVGLDASVILANVAGTALVTVAELAEIIFALICLVVGVVVELLAVVDVTIYAVISGCCCALCEVLGSLVCAVFSVVGTLLVGLVAAVAGLLLNVHAIVAILVTLKVNVFLKVFAGLGLF